jgi:hypothetical protein
MTKTNAPRALRLNEADNIVVAVDAFAPGFAYGSTTASERVPRGHKMAIAPIAAGEPVLLQDEALRRADPGLRSLWNVNTPEEYEARIRFMP